MRKQAMWWLVIVGYLALALPALAGKPPAICGDGRCNRGETSETCASDCGGAETPPTCVTLADRLDGATFTGDGLGDYCADERGVSIHLATNFSFSIDDKRASRHLELDLDACPGTETPCTIDDVSTANTGNLSEYALIDGEFFALGGLDFQAMEDGDETFAGLRINFPSDSRSTPHQVLFGSVGDFDCVALGGTPVSVARGGNSWVFMAVLGVHKGCLLTVEDKNRRVFQGLVDVGFVMTVVTP